MPHSLHQRALRSSLEILLVVGLFAEARAQTSVPPLVAASAEEVVWRDDDDRPIPKPAVDSTGDYLWWDHGWSLLFYQLGKVLDVGHALQSAGAAVGVVDPIEAANVNALDEVPDSSWFTNRHGLRRMSAQALGRGPNRGPAPATDGRLTVLSGKPVGITPGFIFEDERGHRYLVKVDPPDVPDMATGAEIVSSRIVHAAGWNIPAYHLIRFSPRRLVIDPQAEITDEYNRKRPMTKVHLDAILLHAAQLPGGSVRAVASQLIAGEPLGPFHTLGVRRDDSNDSVRHEERRDLRGLRIVAAWIHHTDARRGNFFDTFVEHPDAPPGHGHVVHYLLDFSSTLGSEDTRWKPPRFGHEYALDPPIIGANLITFGLWVKPWERPRPVEHRSLGRFDSEHFDPEQWKTAFPLPLFDQLTARDEFWGAKLVASFTDDDIRAVVRAGEWSDPVAENALVEVMRARRDRIAEVYFAADRINPVDRFTIAGEKLAYEDLAVETGVVDSSRARYRHRHGESPWQDTHGRRIDLHGLPPPIVVELQTSHDGGDTWSPSTRVTLIRSARDDLRLSRIERDTQ